MKTPIHPSRPNSSVTTPDNSSLSVPNLSGQLNVPPLGAYNTQSISALGLTTVAVTLGNLKPLQSRDHCLLIFYFLPPTFAQWSHTQVKY